MSSVAPLNATQIHALALAHFASELLETFDALSLGWSSQRNQHAGDGLRPDKEALESVVSKVVGPFLAVIRREVGAAVAEAETDPTAIAHLNNVLTRVAPLLARVTFAGDVGQSLYMQSMLATLEIGTIWSCLAALANRPIPRTAAACEELPLDALGGEVRRSVSAGELRNSESEKEKSGDSLRPPQADYVSQLPSYVTPPDTPQVSPFKVLTDVDVKEKERRLSVSSAGGKTSARLLTPPATKKLSLVKLPSLKPLTSARAPSPPQGHAVIKASSESKLSASTTSSSPPSSSSSPPSPRSRSGTDAASVIAPLDCLLVALRGIARDTHIVCAAIKRLPLPLEGGLARDAVDEATKEMTGFLAFMEYLIGVDTNAQPTLQGRLRDVEHLMRKTRQTPMLLAMPILLRVALASSPFSTAPDTVSGWIALSEGEYRQTCLTGFRKADECAPIVGKAFLKNKMCGGLGWMKEWTERSTREEEEDSSDDEDDTEPGRF